MFFYLVFLFVATPITELYLLVRVADFIQWGPTILIVLVTGVLGATLAKRQGIFAWQRVQSELSAGRIPTAAFIDALLILVAGLMLLTPGFITDAVGFALLIPPIRTVIKRRLANRFRSRVVMNQDGQVFVNPDGQVFMNQHGQVDMDDDGDGFIDVRVTDVRDSETSRSLIP